MKKKFISVLLCGAMTASLFGMGAMAEETKTFTVGFDAEYPPYGYMGEMCIRDRLWKGYAVAGRSRIWRYHAGWFHADVQAGRDTHGS